MAGELEGNVQCESARAIGQVEENQPRYPEYCTDERCRNHGPDRMMERCHPVAQRNISSKEPMEDSPHPFEYAQGDQPQDDEHYREEDHVEDDDRRDRPCGKLIVELRIGPIKIRPDIDADADS